MRWGVHRKDLYAAGDEGSLRPRAGRASGCSVRIEKCTTYFCCTRCGWDATRRCVRRAGRKRSAYYLMGGGDPALRNSGATALVLWSAIQFAASVAPAFDFEGSMLEPVERFVRAFGARPESYSALERITSPSYLMYRAIRQASALARRRR